MINKAYASESMTVNDGERAVVAKICVPIVDRDGEVVMPQGCVSKDYEMNPVVFYCHDSKTPPVAKCVSLKRANDHLMAKCVFASRPDNHVGEWLPDTLFSLYQQKVLNAFSVGFVPIEERVATKGDREVYGMNCKRVFSKWNLLEYSVVPIPANQGALAVAVSKGIVTASRVKELFGVDVEDAPTPRKKVVAVYRPRGEDVNIDAVVAAEFMRMQDRKCGVLYSS